MRYSAQSDKNAKIEQRYNTPGNQGAVFTLLLIMRALHDVYGFGGKRLWRMLHKFEAQTDLKWAHIEDMYTESVVKRGGSELLYQEFISRFIASTRHDDTFSRMNHVNVLITPVSRKRYTDYAEVTYKLCLIALAQEYKFGAKRLQTVQSMVKADLRAMKERRIKGIEIMNMLQDETGLEFEIVQWWKDKYGGIYNADGMPY